MNPRIALMVITDGRWDYLRQCLASAEANLGWQFVEKIIVDDSAAPGCPEPPGWKVVHNEERQGLAGAIQVGWDALPECDYVFHLEDDFTFPQTVDVESMVRHLQVDPCLAQVALLRQPWSPDERDAGSVYAMNPQDYNEVGGVVLHHRLFTFNPCLYPVEILQYGAGLEQELTDRLLGDAWHFGYLGGLNDPPRCWHIGARRSPGYKL